MQSKSQVRTIVRQRQPVAGAQEPRHRREWRYIPCLQKPLRTVMELQDVPRFDDDLSLGEGPQAFKWVEDFDMVVM